MNRLEKNIAIIHDLLQIQHERASTYEKMLYYSNYEPKVNSLLKKMAMQSRNAILELRGHITDTTGGDPADRVEIRGEILKGWNGLDQFLPDSNFKQIIQSFEVNERRTGTAYELALESCDELCEEVRKLIKRQLQQVRRSFKYIQEAGEIPFIPKSLPATDERKPPAFFHDRLYAQV